MTWTRREPQRRPADTPAARPSGDDSLEQLLALVARGDEQAFAELYQRVAPALFGLVSKVVRNPSQAEEVTQEVFVELWRTASRFDPARGTARSWIMTCAHRRAVDRVRSSQSAARRDDLVGRRDQGRPYDEVVEQVEANLEREHVRRGLDALTELQREAVVLAYYGGYTYREISELLGVPSGTVKTRLRDGLIRLRDHLGVDA
ncbi:MAG TPA: ECF RNA polymerase sigma factor SigK [Actinomycetes bacterium]|nr:ECF RNA polymerase sigma factor SigK [Actinomycetes bacterium]